MLLILTGEERAVIISFLESLMKTEAAGRMSDPLSEFVELLKEAPNQSSKPTLADGQSG
jgi:hypothetical protein